eukprot:TRINITY_DN21025_c0_g1_i2.p1 TRINITY_DN21025_c0_g1~~TRINITY_DN21025_c0_g1_i2.p1  ORF type:complete len:891 (-),score=247.66 TRINITY_DN21025_c0_g1_i2:8-2680(-)
MAEEAERMQKLKEKYNTLKQNNAVLKKGLLDKQEECTRLEQQLKEKETTLRQQMEEIDHLQFQNGRMSKQLGTLTAQVEEQQKQKQQSSWSVGGLIGGKQQQEAIQKAENELTLLRDELMMKIQENEDLHMRVFEGQKQHEEEAERLRDTEASRGRDLERSVAELGNTRREVEKLSGENHDMVQRISTLENQLSASAQLSASLRSQLDTERYEANKTVQALRSKLTRWVPFDDSQYEIWSDHSLSSRHGRLTLRRAEVLNQMQSAVQEACHQNAGALQVWPAALGAGGGDEESAGRLRIRTKMAEAAQKLGELVAEVAPNLASMFGAAGLAFPGPQREIFRRKCSELLSSHRRWVLYQSFLLLHEWQSAFAGRSAQEEALAQSFVDCLWRLHRCVRRLFARLRICLFLPALHTRSSSTAHFALAREALVRKAAPASASSDLEIGAREDSGTQAASLLGQVQRSLADVSQCWRALGRCLSSWAAAQGSSNASAVTASAAGAVAKSQEESGTVVGLLGCIHGFCGCLTDRLIPAVEKLSSAGEGSGLGSLPLLFPACRMGSTSSTEAKAGHIATPYMQLAQLQLESSPAAIGLEDSVRTLQLARRVAAARAQLQAELKQQLQRMQAITSEKSKLCQELSSLQDSHALLQSNLEVLKVGGSQAVPASDPRDSPGARDGKEANTPHYPAASSELLVSSRQRALLGSLAVTAQESSGMMQHGFFVDVLSLSGGEASLAGGPPHPETLDSWELAVRKVYEQHVCNLQKQVMAADGKAWEMNLHTQDYCDQVQRQEQEKQELINEVASRQTELGGLREDIEATRKNYDNQLAMLTEHICALSARLSEKDASLASLQAHKVLCGHCGMWNAMGKLLSSDPGGGTCQTCKEKVLSPGVS